ncbi:MAG: polysaccharide deacetylase family protein [Halocynthiibacter sp.]
MALHIIMYHYVRDFAASPYSGIKGLDIREFQDQLDHLSARFEILSPQCAKDRIAAKSTFQDDCCWLTFDDGYKDHITHVAPALEQRGLRASFFAPVRTTRHAEVLDVNKIHFILSEGPGAAGLLAEVRALYLEFGTDTGTGGVDGFGPHLKAIDSRSRFDDATTIQVKRLLQAELPLALRQKICDRLFEKYVSADQVGFAQELYMGAADISTLHAAGHEIGAHGVNHYWFSRLTRAGQEAEITGSLDYLRGLAVLGADWSMCFPYGDHDDTTLELLQKHGCAIGLTVRPEPVRGDRYSGLALPRFDTNDFPGARTRR